MRISDLLRGKGSVVVTIAPDASVADLVELLGEHNIGAVAVLDGTRMVGIVSERDIVRRLRTGGAGLLDATVADIMTREVVWCAPDESVDRLAETMTQRRIRHMPVVANDRLAGIVSIGDVVKSRISQLESDRAQLESYIAQG